MSDTSDSLLVQIQVVDGETGGAHELVAGEIFIVNLRRARNDTNQHNEYYT